MNFPAHEAVIIASMRNYMIHPHVSVCPSVLNFRPVTADALPRIAELLRRSASRSCDYTVGGIFMWTDWFNYRYCIVDDTLFIEGSMADAPAHTAYSLPVGNMETGRAVDLLRIHSRICGRPLRFSAIPEDSLHLFADIPGCRISEMAGWGDYIYDINVLITLAGNPLKRKRNHVNRFIADNPAWSLEAMTDGNVREAMDLLWRIDAIMPSDSLMASVERRETYRVLEMWPLLSRWFTGAILRDGDGRTVAFTVGEILGDTLFVHIEKADHSVPGAGEMINHAFAASVAGTNPEVLYVNREDDSGDPSLRASKLSWRPRRILPKFNVEFPPA